MNSSAARTERTSWFSSMLAKLSLWEEALNNDPLRHLEQRLAAVEQELKDLRARTPATSLREP